MNAENNEERPPLGSWPRLYGAIAIYLALIIALFDWFTRTFNR